MGNKLSGARKSIPFLLPLRCVIFLLFFVLLAVITKLPFSELSKWWTAVAIICNIITIATLFVCSYKRGITYKKLINYEKGKTTVKSAVLIVAVTLIVGMSGLYIAGLICYGAFPYLDKTLVQPVPLWLAIIVLLLLPLSTTIAEDGLYLGYAINSGAGNKWLNIALAAFFYALQHSFIPFLTDWKFIIYRFISFLPLTIIICFWYRKNLNPLPFMIGHFILNIATAAQILIMTVFPSIYSNL